jgi:hypothetical protein
MLLACFASGQAFKWDLGGQAGISNYFGDLAETTGTNSLKIYQQNTRFTVGGMARVRMAYRYGFNFQLNYLSITGADSLNPNSDRTSRNLSFRNNMIEAAARFEYYPLIFNDLGGKMRYAADLHLVVFAGLGFTYSSPQAEYNGSWENLRPLQTEGVSYSAVQPVMPLGFGTFVTFKGRSGKIRRHRIGIDVSYRLAFTDYLDDVSTTYVDNAQLRTSQGDMAADLADRRANTSGSAGGIRGNPEDNDGYGTITISYSYVIATGRGNFYRPKYNYIYGNSPAAKRRVKF